MQLQSYLDRMGVWYHLSHHPAAYRASDLAQAEHVPGDQVIKPVVVNADGRLVMCALPASYKLDLDRLRDRLHAEKVGLADESLLGQVFGDCELAAEPPIGFLYGMPTIMDESLKDDAQVTFQAGTHESAVTMKMSDFCRVAQPEIAPIARHI